MTNTKTHPSQDVLISTLLLVITVGIYLLWPNKKFSIDSLDFAYSAREGQDLFHPHHLLYNGLGYLLYKFINPLNYGVSDILIWLNSLVGGMIVLVSYQFLRKVGISAFLSVLISLSIGFNGAFWKYAVTIEVYHLSILFFALSFYLTAFHIESGWNIILLLSLTTSLAVFFHQTGVFVAISVVPFFLKERRLLRYVAYLGISGSICFSVYYLAAWSQEAIFHPSDFFGWATISTNGTEMFGYRGLRFMLFGSIVGVIRSFFPLELFSNLFVGKQTIDFRLVITLGMISLYFSGLLFLLSGLRKNLKRYSTLGFGLFLWMLPSAILGAVWDPSDPEAWFPLIIPLFLFIGININPLRKNFLVLAISLLVIFMVNFTFSIYPNSKEKSNDARNVANTLLENGLANGDLLLINCPEILPFLKMYHGIKVEIFTLGDQIIRNNKNKTEAIIKKLNERMLKGNVFISSEERFPNPNKLVYKNYSYSMKDFETIYGKYGLSPLKQHVIVSLRGRPINLYKLSLLSE